MSDTEMAGTTIRGSEPEQKVSNGISHKADSLNGDDMEVDGGALLPDEGKSHRLPVTVNKPIPYTFDLGNLLANDANPLPSQVNESVLQSTARDAAQALINQLLTTCPINSTSDGVLLQLPEPNTPLPREKPVPVPKPPTKWELFAAKKGIKDKRKEGKLVFDEEKQDWVPKWGYKGKNKDADNQWLVEVDDKKERETGEAHDARAEGRAERKERIKRNERRMRANERRAGTK